MYTIEFERKRDESLDDVALSMAVEGTISKYASQLLSKDRRRASFRDMENGILGMHVTRYETDSHGVIEYREFIVSRGYVSQVELQGFNEEEEIFKAIRGELEGLKEKSNQELKELVTQETRSV